jgi:uncharacterized protein involved in response to NO
MAFCCSVDRRLGTGGIPIRLEHVGVGRSRLAVTFSAIIGWFLAAVIDGTFLALVASAAAREILAGHNWGNLKVSSSSLS